MLNVNDINNIKSSFIFFYLWKLIKNRDKKYQKKKSQVQPESTKKKVHKKDNWQKDSMNRNRRSSVASLSPSQPVLGPWLYYLFTLSFLSPRSRIIFLRFFILFLFIFVGSFGSLILFLSSTPPSVEEGLQTLKWSTPETDEHWKKVIKEGKFISSHIFKPLESAISEKFIVTLEYEGIRYKTMAKAIEDPRWIGYIGETYNLNTNKSAKVYRRHSDTRKYQGYPELAAYHVDRVLGYYRKPPFIGKVFNSKDLYENWVHINQFRMKDIFRSLAYKFDALYSQHNIYVAQSPWMDGIINKPLPSSIKDALNFETPLSIKDLQKDSLFYYELVSVSDTLVFDYLVDEHDRKEEKNWVVSLNNPNPKYQSTYLIWDNGLSFDHGPKGKISCMDILCGRFVFITH